jgi:hypothetical protein
MAPIRFYDVEPQADRPVIPIWAAKEPGHHGLHEVPQIGDEVRLFESQDVAHWWRVIRRSHDISANGAQLVVLGVRFIS